MITLLGWLCAVILLSDQPQMEQRLACIHSLVTYTTGQNVRQVQCYSSNLIHAINVNVFLIYIYEVSLKYNFKEHLSSQGDFLKLSVSFVPLISVTSCVSPLRWYNHGFVFFYAKYNASLMFKTCHYCHYLWMQDWTFDSNTQYMPATYNRCICMW